MHRRPVLQLLDRYGAAYPDEDERVERFRSFVRSHPECLERRCGSGHLTASAWIVSADRASVLLTLHAKLGRWLQLGGHADGEADLLAAATREAREESGMERFEVPGAPAPVPLDLDVHEIPGRGAEPAHLHYDVRFLLAAGAGQRLLPTAESRELRWVERRHLLRLSHEPSLIRMERKARLRLG